MVARGVLIDYKKYADTQGIEVDLFNNDKITIADIEKIAESQGVEFKFGDVLIVRSGFTEALGEMTGEEQTEALSSYRACGVEGTEKAAKWFWNNHFSAVAGDMIAFEHIPPIINGKEGEGGIDLGQYHFKLYVDSEDHGNSNIGFSSLILSTSAPFISHLFDGNVHWRVMGPQGFVRALRKGQTV